MQGGSSHQGNAASRAVRRSTLVLTSSAPMPGHGERRLRQHRCRGLHCLCLGFKDKAAQTEGRRNVLSINGSNKVRTPLRGERPSEFRNACVAFTVVLAQKYGLKTVCSLHCHEEYRLPTLGVWHKCESQLCSNANASH